MTNALPGLVLLAALGAVEALKMNAPNGSLIAPKKKRTYNRFNGQFHNLQRYQCTNDTVQLQFNRWKERDHEWWSHTACPAQYWLDNLPKILKKQGKREVTFMDVGCNKGYTSAKFFDSFTPGSAMNPQTVHESILSSNVKFDRDCGVCDDCRDTANNEDTNFDKVTVHCFEPSPSSMSLLKATKDRIFKTNSTSQEWVLHEMGVSNTNGEMWWDGACKNIGDETCKIVDKNTTGAVKIPTYTVDAFLIDYSVKAVDILKIDAEGYDPAVLLGSENLLRSGKMPVVTFEYNPLDRVGGLWQTTKLENVVTTLDSNGYDCYFESNLKKHNGEFNSPGEFHNSKDTPSLYLITGGCLPESAARSFRGWSNVVCALRANSGVASMFRELATLLKS
jgi:FkbM family methyltransferase